MYHCHLKFYLIGNSCRIFEVIKEMAPFEHLTHTFWESEKPEISLSEKPEVIQVSTQGLESEETLKLLLAHKQ